MLDDHFRDLEHRMNLDASGANPTIPRPAVIKCTQESPWFKESMREKVPKHAFNLPLLLDQPTEPINKEIP